MVAKICEKDTIIMLSDRDAYLKAREERVQQKQNFFDAAQTGINEWLAFPSGDVMKV
jgi:hypothetical protein